MRRKGLGQGTGKGYKNIIGKDSSVHSQSARGIKQPTSINESKLNAIDRNIKEQCPICKEWLYSDETHYVCESNEELSKDKFFLEEQKKEELTKEYKKLLNRDIDDLSINIENRRIKNRMNEIEEIFRKEDEKLKNPSKDFDLKDSFRSLKIDYDTLTTSDLQGIVMAKSINIMEKLNIPKNKLAEVEDLLLNYSSSDMDFNSTKRFLLELGQRAVKIEDEIVNKPLLKFKKADQRRSIASISYQFGKIKSSETSEKLFNKNLEELNIAEFDELFEYMRIKRK